MIPAISESASRAARSIATFAVVGGVNVLGVSPGSRLNQITTVATLALTVTAVPASGDVLRASIVLIFAFSGTETALVPSGEMQDPARTVPRAIFVAMNRYIPRGTHRMSRSRCSWR